jgi:acetolactate synthase-1/2/3 large subunit
MMEEVQVTEQNRANEVARAAVLEDEVIDRALTWIGAAKNPIVLTEHVGGSSQAVEALVALCERFAIPVMESYRPAYLNFPRTHPLYQQYDAKLVDSSDLILAVNALTPWYPASKGPKENAKVIYVADEFPNSRLPFWGYNVDLALIAPPVSTLQKLVERTRTKEFSANQSVYHERMERMRQAHARQAEALKSDAEKHARDIPIDPRWLCYALSQSIPPDAIITEETTVYRNLIQDGIPRSQPMSYFARITGGLGVGLGYALGVKLAMPERTVFALVGDGAFHYNPAPACLGVAQEYSLPINIVVFNNQRYLSMERSLLKYFPRVQPKRPAYTSAGRLHQARSIV